MSLVRKICDHCGFSNYSNNDCCAHCGAFLNDVQDNFDKHQKHSYRNELTKWWEENEKNWFSFAVFIGFGVYLLYKLFLFNIWVFIIVTLFVLWKLFEKFIDIISGEV